MGVEGKPHRQAESGFALPTVVWVLALVSLIAIGFMASAHTMIRIAANIEANEQAKALAEAGISSAILDLIEARRTQGRSRRIPADGRNVTCSTPAGDVIEIEVEDEAGKLDVNAASEAQLMQILARLGVARSDAGLIAGSIADYRDADSLRRLNGAEDPEYRQAGRVSGPANAPLVDVDELELVLGMPKGLVEQLRPLLTVHAEAAGSVFTIRALARSRSGGTAAVSAIVDIRLKRGRAFEIRTWHGHVAGDTFRQPAGRSQPTPIGPC